MEPYSPIVGTAYGIALNDRDQLAAIGDVLHSPPHGAPPNAPVLYIKPRNCFSFGGAPVRLPKGLAAVRVAATIGVLFARDVTRANAEEVRGAIGAACLALDVSEAGADYFRPQVRQQCRDGFLPLGGIGPLSGKTAEIVTEIDGRTAHRWGFERLHRSIEAAVVDITSFMTFRAGDLLLSGVPGDAPEVGPGATVAVHSRGLPSLRTTIQGSDHA